MLSRRNLLIGAGAPLALSAAPITHRQRVDRVLAGQDTDRPAFGFWYHFLDETQPARVHAENTLQFHRKFKTDLVKVMSDYPYPKPKGKWHEARVEQNPFPEQIRSLEIIRDSLNQSAHFIETIFNPWTVAEKLSSKEEVQRLKQEKPQALLDALEAIAKSEASHARRAIAAGASGIFLAIANAQEGVLTPQDYASFSEPFDKMVLSAAAGAPLNTLHLHGDKVYLDRFYTGWPAGVINYSVHATGVPLSRVRAHFTGVIMGGVDERNFRTLERVAFKRQVGFDQAGKKYIVAPGCSIPNETKDEEIRRFTQMFGV
jgi:uroporphyrinogen decarboxylase